MFRILRQASVPLPIKQFEVLDGDEFLARPDFAYPEARLAIEADSYRFHSGRQAWEEDLARRSALVAAGWQVLHVTWRRLERDPAGVVRQVQKALGLTLV